MAIEVVRRGHLPEEDQFEAQCYRCKSDIRFLRSDAKFTADQRDGDFVTIACPVCQTAVNVASNKGRPPPPKRG